MRTIKIFGSLGFALLLFAGCEKKQKGGATLQIISNPTRTVAELIGEAKDIAPFEIESDSTASGGQCIVLPEVWGSHGELHPAYITKDGVLISAKKNLSANPLGKELMPNGTISASIDIKTKGNYRIWVRAKFDNSCANSFHLGINTGAPLDRDGDGAYEVNTPFVISGTTYKHWKWYALNELMELNSGANSFKIYNREDGIRVDQIMCVEITDSPTSEYEPQGIETSSE